MDGSACIGGYISLMKLSYYKRVFQAYLGGGTSQLSFWHGTPEVNEAAFETDSPQYYMTFRGKANYPGPFDDKGIPMLDYRGVIGQQYNPIAIAQYGLSHRWPCPLGVFVYRAALLDLAVL